MTPCSFGKCFWKSSALLGKGASLFIVSSIVAAYSEILEISSSGGLPVSSMIFSSWFIVDAPGKTGFAVSISPRMQPTAHMSTALVYCGEPSLQDLGRAVPARRAT